MRDSLEDFINENKAAFDTVEYADVEQFWDERKQERNGRFSRNIWRPIAIAATILVAIGIYRVSIKNNVDQPKKWVIEELQNIDPNLESYQMMLVNTLQEQDLLIKNLNVDPEEHEDIFRGLEEINHMEEKYKSDLNTHGPNQKIIMALLKCAKQRIRLYELILYRIELKNYHENEEYQI